MTLIELKSRIRQMAERQDPGDHDTAEQLLLEYIGDPELTDLWDDAAMGWWYS